MTKREQMVKIYLTEDEKQKIKKIANKKGLSKSSFGRQKLLKAAGEA
jgi:hypothetical protein